MVFILIIKKKSEDKAIQIRSLYSFPKNSENVLYLQKKKQKILFFLEFMDEYLLNLNIMNQMNWNLK